jgi:AbrB family looped-hinge helix DNA binding protein
MTMQTTISSKFQVVIPKALRERLDLRPRQKLTILEKGGILYLVPDQEVKTLRGIARGVEVADYRDKSDRT